MNNEKTLDSSTEFELRLPKFISDGMVLQRGTKVRIWGWAEPGEEVTVKFLDEAYSCTADISGKWAVLLDEMEAGGPYTMEIDASTSVHLKNILVGDVWICSGQSNMVIPMERVHVIYEDEIANCENPYIRQFIVPDKYDFNSPREDVEGGDWKEACAETIFQFSAAGYFFAKKLYEKYHVPIGLIRACVGGTPVEAWTSEEALKAFPNKLDEAEILKNDEYVKDVKKKEEIAINAWFNGLNSSDKGFIQEEQKWFDESYDDSEWESMNIPCIWEEEGLEPLCGAVWFRKEIYIPDSMSYKPGRLLLGTIIDSDTAYVNGTVVGNTGYQYPPRRYNIPENVLKPGKNVVTVRVISNSGSGSFIKDKPYKLIVGNEEIDLKGEWKYRVGAVANCSLPSTTFFEYKPFGLFNGMISPLLNYRMKGVIWYQGESNTGDPKGYSEVFSTMIEDWRSRWKQGDFPFLFVQLANLTEPNSYPCESNWAELRQEQLKTLDVSKTGMAVTIDIGEWNDLHPLNKKDVGNRLSLLAQKIAYGNKEVVSSGPIYKAMKVVENKVIISFTSIGGGLIAKDSDKLKHFAITGADKKFVWANAAIEGDRVIVWSEEVKEPVAVRYAWADNPSSANLYNKEGLPAAPFTTE